MHGSVDIFWHTSSPNWSSFPLLWSVFWNEGPNIATIAFDADFSRSSTYFSFLTTHSVIFICGLMDSFSFIISINWKSSSDFFQLEMMFLTLLLPFHLRNHRKISIRKLILVTFLEWLVPAWLWKHMFSYLVIFQNIFCLQLPIEFLLSRA